MPSIEIPAPSEEGAAVVFTTTATAEEGIFALFGAGAAYAPSPRVALARLLAARRAGHSVEQKLRGMVEEVVALSNGWGGGEVVDPWVAPFGPDEAEAEALAAEERAAASHGFTHAEVKRSSEGLTLSVGWGRTRAELVLTDEGSARFSAILGARERPEPKPYEASSGWYRLQGAVKALADAGLADGGLHAELAAAKAELESVFGIAEDGSYPDPWPDAAAAFEGAVPPQEDDSWIVRRNPAGAEDDLGDED